MNEMPNSKPCRKDLLMQIGHASFAVDDVKLYLDTHPRDQEALDFFYEYNKKRNQLLKEYAKYYGPLTVDTAVPSCHGHGSLIQFHLSEQVQRIQSSRCLPE